jgi:hypothetical protein
MISQMYPMMHLVTMSRLLVHRKRANRKIFSFFVLISTYFIENIFNILLFLHIFSSPKSKRQQEIAAKEAVVADAVAAKEKV